MGLSRDKHTLVSRKVVRDVYDHNTVTMRQALISFPGGSDSKESVCSAGNPGLIPGLGRSPGEGNRNPLQHSCLENSIDRGAWQATVHGVAKSWT